MRHAVVRLLLWCLGAVALVATADAQELQLHYDWRHTFDARNNPRNFPSVTFKSYKGLSFGSFLLKLEGDLNGSRDDLSKVYLEVSQTFRFWAPPIFAHVGYSGGLGLFDGATGGYYIDNAYLFGADYPFRWLGSWGNGYLAYRVASLPRPSHDPEFSLYWGKVVRGRWSLASDGEFWTVNRNRGDSLTANLTGKRVALLVENEVWYRILSLISVGCEIRVSRNVYATDGRLLVYPTVGIRYLF
jgi:hypothetical protein